MISGGSRKTHGLSKAERLCGKSSVERVFACGRWGALQPLRYCWAPREEGPTRILVSVPKKFFKRAVKRNLLKRRMREAFRLQKDLLGGRSYDILFLYNSPYESEFQPLREEMALVLKEISSYNK